MIVDTFFWANWPRWFQKMVLDMRQLHLDQGGQPEEFNKWFEEMGCRQVGPITIISDELAVYARLKYA